MPSSKQELLAQLVAQKAKLQASPPALAAGGRASSRDVTASPRAQKLEAPPKSSKQMELAARKAELKKQHESARKKTKKAVADVAARGKDVAESQRVHEIEARGAAERQAERQAEKGRVQDAVAVETLRVHELEAAHAHTAAALDRAKVEHDTARKAAEEKKRALAASKAARVQELTVELEYSRPASVRQQDQYLDGSALLMKGDPNAEGDLFSFVDYLPTTEGLPESEARSRPSRQQAPGLKHSGDIWFDEKGKRQKDSTTAVRCKQRIDVDLVKVGKGWSHLFFVLSSFTKDAQISEFISDEVPCLLTIRNARTPDAEPLAVVASAEAQDAAQIAFIICSLERCPDSDGADWQFFARYAPCDGHAPTLYDETFGVCFDLMAANAERGEAAYSKLRSISSASNVMRFGHKLKVRAQLKLQQKQLASCTREGRGGTSRGGTSNATSATDAAGGGGAAAAAAQQPLAELVRKHKYDCFLSHNWGKDELGRDNHARVVHIAGALKAAGLRPWLDEELMAGDINNTMSEAIDDSACVVVFVTENYVKKASGKGPNGSDDNCKFEFDTALNTEHVGLDRMVTVVMEPNCLNPKKWPSGTVKGKLATKLYVNLSSDSDDDKLSEGCQSLIREVEKALRAAA